MKVEADRTCMFLKYKFCLALVSSLFMAMPVTCAQVGPIDSQELPVLNYGWALLIGLFLWLLNWKAPTLEVFTNRVDRDHTTSLLLDQLLHSRACPQRILKL